MMCKCERHVRYTYNMRLQGEVEIKGPPLCNDVITVPGIGN